MGSGRDCLDFFLSVARLRLVTDAAYGVSASYSLLRVDVTKRLFGGKARPAVTLRLADGVGGVRCP